MVNAKPPEEWVKASKEVYEQMTSMWQKMMDPKPMIAMMKTQMEQFPEELRDQFSESLTGQLEGMKNFTNDIVAEYADLTK